MKIINKIIDKLSKEQIKKLISILSKLFNLVIEKLTPEQLAEIRRLLKELFSKLYGKMNNDEENLEDLEKMGKKAKEKGAFEPDFRSKYTSLLYFFLVVSFVTIVAIMMRKKYKKNNDVS
jgi:hypothetical protein